MTARTTYFQKKSDVSSVVVTIKSGVGGAETVIPHIEKEHSENLLSWYEPIRKPKIDIEQEME